jgi:hypothetical protein
MIKLMDILTERRDYVRDRRGVPLGTLEILSTGMHILRDRQGRKLGIYNSKTDKTFDHTGTIVGRGNVLSSLITIYK